MHFPRFCQAVAAALTLALAAHGAGCASATDGDAQPAPTAPSNGVPGLNLLGVDYAPNHFPAGDPRNTESQVNVREELRQLKSAGFTAVRLYGDPGKTWVAVIKAADELGMQVFYQLGICQSDASGACAKADPNAVTQSYDEIEKKQLTQLGDVIDVVGKATFQKVVKMVIVGNEVLWTDGDGSRPPTTSNADKIVHSVTQTKDILDKAGLGSTPMTVALQADVWIDDAGIGRQEILAALPPGSPIAINAYPFQWSVKVDDAMDPSNVHSLPYYVDTIAAKYGRSVVISETGWASAGAFNLGSNRVIGNPADAARYYAKLYAYATTRNVPTLTFMAFDTPTKSFDANFTSENFYGAFDQACALKGPQFIPNQSYAAAPGCNDNQSVFTFAGSTAASETAMAPFAIEIARAGEPLVKVEVPTLDRSAARQAITPWPSMLLVKGDVVTLRSATHTCSNTVVSVDAAHSGGTWQTPFSSEAGCENFTNGAVAWSTGQTIFMPEKF